MTTEKLVLSKLFTKTELGTHEIHLSLIDDLRKMANNSSKLNAESNNLIEKVRSNFRESLSILGKVETEATKGLKMALDLGIGESLYKDFLDAVKGDISVNKKLLDKYS
jgi:hypothetical protein